MSGRYFLMVLVAVAYCGHAQSVFPYDLSWGRFPFAKEYSNVDRLSATTFLGKRDLKKGIPQTVEEIYFDDQGRAIREATNFFSNSGSICWKYADDGCPSAIYCEPDSNLKVLKQRFTCQAGRFDSIFGDQGFLKVMRYDEMGRETTTIQYQKNRSSGVYEFQDSIQAKYDEQGRYAGFLGPDYRMEVRYLQDSIVIERYHHGILKSTREIKCGRYGLPVLMQTWVYSERRNRKKSLWLYSTLEYEFRE